MIKNWLDTTVGDFAKMERTGKVSQYKSWYNILPTFLFYNKIRNLVINIGEAFGEKKITDDDESKRYQIISLDKINLLELHLQYVYFILVNQVELQQILKSVKVKTKFKGVDIEKLKDSVTAIEDITGIKMDSDPLKKMQEVRAEIEFLRDKYKENYYTKPEVEEVKEKISILKYVGQYVMYTGGDLQTVSNMKIIDVLNVKDIADEKYKKEQEQYNKIKNGRD